MLKSFISCKIKKSIIWNLLIFSKNGLIPNQVELVVLFCEAGRTKLLKIRKDAAVGCAPGNAKLRAKFRDRKRVFGSVSAQEHALDYVQADFSSVGIHGNIEDSSLYKCCALSLF